jgi:hypothetical protein
MSLLEKLEGSFKYLIEQIAIAKENLVLVLADKDLPLEERWELFVNSPDMLKNHRSDIVHFKCIDKGGYFDWQQGTFNYERYETVNLVDVIHRLEHSGDYFLKKKPGKEFLADPKFIEEFKEEILSMNLASFVYDW